MITLYSYFNLISKMESKKRTDFRVFNSCGGELTVDDYSQYSNNDIVNIRFERKSPYLYITFIYLSDTKSSIADNSTKIQFSEMMDIVETSGVLMIPIRPEWSNPDFKFENTLPVNDTITSMTPIFTHFGTFLTVDLAQR